MHYRWNTTLPGSITFVQWVLAQLIGYKKHYVNRKSHFKSLFDAENSQVHSKRLNQYSKLIKAFMENKSVLPEGERWGILVVVACLFGFTEV